MNELVTKDLTTTSLAIAELFGKRHSDILRAIRNIIKDFNPEELNRRKIALVDYLDAKGEKRASFEIGEDMTLIITGRLTGKEELKAQLKLADAFIAMRDFIRAVDLVKTEGANVEMLWIDLEYIEAVEAKYIKELGNIEQAQIGSLILWFCSSDDVLYLDAAIEAINRILGK